MPLLDQQRQGRELGRIRIGRQVTFTKRDGTEGRRPTKLEAFRFTTHSRINAQMVADIYGGEVEPWIEKPGQFEVMTTATELPVMIPPGRPLTQHYELWSRGGVQRRCDSIRQESGAPCACPAEIPARMAAAAGNPPAACKPMSRLNVCLPDLADLGVWLIVSGGYHAAHELAGTADFLHRAAQADHFLPAILRLEQRSSTANGQTNHYAVPVLELTTTLREIVSGEAFRESGMTLPPAPPNARAITAGATSGISEQAPPLVATEPIPADPEDDPGVIDAELVPTAEEIAPHVIECATRADLTVLINRAKDAHCEDHEVNHPTTGALMTLKTLISARWRELPE